MFEAYHKSLETLHIGCEEPRAYFIPFTSAQAALKGGRENSERFMSLCGEWDFRFYNSFEDLEDDFLSLPFSEKIAVPMCWQLLLDREYDAPLYSNLKYPFPLDPPHVPDNNPCGLYSRSFTLPESFGEKVFINFEGVASCFYLFVNDSFAAYSQVSHCTSEIDITKYLVSGENKIAVLVVKWCDGTYLEDQDCFRLSGIFREVYLLGREENYLRDLYVRTDVCEDLSRANISIEADTDADTEFTLYSPDGEELHRGGGKITIESPVLWNAEEPKLYTLLVRAGDEFIARKIGIKRLEIIGSVVYLNGKKVKLWGINRHDSSPTGGYTVSVEQMWEELCSLKRANCNCVRTSHYPNDPRFVDMCDEIGMMLVDEADIETHGMGFEYRDTWDWMRWSKLSTDDEWEAAYVDRAKRLFERDKNSVSVVMWSLGNESGCGKNHRAMRKYIKSRDSRAIVHYENAHLEFKAVPEGENFADISDVESRMYAELGYTENYLQNNPAKPFYFCEYVCSYSTGNIYAHCRMADRYDSLFGLCVWEMKDHAIAVEGKNGTGYRYGGDFGDEPNDQWCCVDGLAFPDGEWRPGMLDMKRAYQPFTVTENGGKISVFNKRFFTSLNDLEIHCRIEQNGKTVYTKVITDTDIQPRESKEFEVFDCGMSLTGECYLNLEFLQKADTAWANSGYSVGFEQFKLEAKENAKKQPCGSLSYTQGRRYIDISAGSTQYVFDKAYGTITRLAVDGKDTLKEPVSINTWMAHPRNLDGAEKERRSAGMDTAVQKTYSCCVEESEGTLKIGCDISVGGYSVTPFLRGRLCYTFTCDGAVTIGFDGEKNPLAPTLPKFGYLLTLNSEYENITFLGKGPNECYSDRLPAAVIGLHEMKVKDNFVHYIRPMENSAHAMTRFGMLTDENGSGVMLSTDEENGFYFNAGNYTAQQLEQAGHNDELTAQDSVFVSVDRHIVPFGGNGYYDREEPSRVYDDSKLSFTVKLRGITKDSDPFELV